jgi:hypothetical protein
MYVCSVYLTHWVFNIIQRTIGFQQTSEYYAIVNTSTHRKIFPNKIPSQLMIMMPFNPSLNWEK